MNTEFAPVLELLKASAALVTVTYCVSGKVLGEYRIKNIFSETIQLEPECVFQRDIFIPHPDKAASNWVPSQVTTRDIVIGEFDPITHDIIPVFKLSIQAEDIPHDATNS